MGLVASMIGKLDMHSGSCEADVAVLVKVGATIWELSSGPGGHMTPAGAAILVPMKKQHEGQTRAYALQPTSGSDRSVKGAAAHGSSASRMLSLLDLFRVEHQDGVG